MIPTKCACCGTWVQTGQVVLRGRVYGRRCAGLVKQALRIAKNPGLARAADFQARHPDKLSHAIQLLTEVK